MQYFLDIMQIKKKNCQWLFSRKKYGSNINNGMKLDDYVMFENYVNSRAPVVAEKMDAVGQEDADINNDGVVDKQDEFLAKRRATISAAIHSKEKSEEEEALNSHYNVNHEALDLCDHLLAHPKKYSKSDIIKILTMANDHLNHKNEEGEMPIATAPAAL